jgi:hypothetical protein
MVSRRWRSRRLCQGKVLLALAAASALASGCASPGEPSARRRPVVPKAVQDLSARQQGDDVVLSFTLPTQSVRNEPLAGPPTVEIYRGTRERPGQATEKVSTRLIYTIPAEMAQSYMENGRIVYRDRIEPQELAHAGSTVSERIYLVRTRIERSRASAESNRVAQIIHPPPAPVGAVSARLVRTNTQPPATVVRLEWPRGAGGPYDVYRAEVEAASAASTAAGGSNMPPHTSLVQLTEVRAPENATDSLVQYLDSSVELGHTYMYIVRRVLETVGPSPVESIDSRPAVITVAEVIPPEPPQEVEAILAPLVAGEPPYVSLSWAISPDANVAGYAVYRSEQEGVRGIRLNEQLVGSPTYRDTTVAAGRRYFYSVTAVDVEGNESAPSTAVQVQIPAAQP